MNQIPLDERAAKRKAQVIKAMAHPSRLMIIHALGDGEMCVGDLQKVVGSDVSTVSKHLSVLRNASIVEDRKSGLQVYYRLRLPCVAEFLSCVDAMIENRPFTMSHAIEETCPV
ncbi:MAG: ArsR/SmtB family transcription factor [Capsulimonadaceae bacterium]